MGSNYCFACGDDNEHGLHLHFTQDGEASRAEFVVQDWFEGWPGIQHGGITSVILDEATAYVPHQLGMVSVTADIRIQFCEPIHIGEALTVTAWPTKKHRKLFEIEAQIVDDKGTIKAKSSAKMMILSDKQKNEMGLDDVPALESRIGSPADSLT